MSVLKNSTDHNPKIVTIASTTTKTTSTKITTTASTASSSIRKKTSIIIIGFLCYHIWIGGTAIISLLLWIGTCFYPRIIGLYIALPYITYTLTIGRYEKKDGLKSNYEFCKNFIMFRILRKYFDMEILYKSCQHIKNMSKTNPNQQYIFAIFPHGAFADYKILMDGMMDEIVPYETACNARTLTASAVFRIPIIRELFLRTGCVDASRLVAERQLKKNRSIAILPGGEAEQIRTRHGKEVVYLQARKGFIKLALRYNVPIVPVYAFGPSDYYKTSSFLFTKRLWLVKNMGICIPFTSGKFGSPICPYPIKTTIVVGKPLVFTIQSPGKPTCDEIQYAHTEFVTELINLFDEYKHIAGYGDRQLEVQ